VAATRRPTLAVEERGERGSRAARRLRRAGFVPGVIYGGDGDGALSFQVGFRDLRAALQDGSAVLDVQVGGGTPQPVIVKDQQFHPVRGEVMHIDLLEVRLDEKIQSTVAVELEGADDAPGVREGGVLEHVTRELNIEALPTDIPERIAVDVSSMEIAGTMHLSEVDVPRGVALLDDLEETIIATITPPSEVGEEPEVEEETELVGEEAAEAAAAEATPEGEGESSGETAGASGEES
jgi:large subunit ribosomal protein L25